MKLDVWLDTPVTVEVPDGTNPDTDDGVEAIKCEAMLKFLQALQEGWYDIRTEEVR